MAYSTILPYILSAGLTMFILLLILLVVFVVRRNKTKDGYDKQLQELMEDDYEEGGKLNQNIIDKWNLYWGKILKNSGLARYSEDVTSAGKDVLAVTVIVAIIVSVIMRNVLAGFGISFTVLWLVGILMKMRSNKKEDSINYQLPGFLFSLKANLQADETNENALMKVIDSMPSPLYDDLVVVKKKLMTNATFSEALEDLSKKTTSRDLKFLCACMIQSDEAGSDMEKQITTIQHVLEARRKVNDEINRAVKAAQPSIWVSTLAIPALLLFGYFMDSSARGFWFVDPLSWGVLAIVGGLYAIGMFFVRKFVNAIRNI